MKLRNAITIMGFALGISAGAQAFGQDPVTGAPEQRDIQKLELTVGKSKVLDLSVAIKRASLANPEVADTVVLSPTQIYLTGKTTGVTNLTLWNESGKLMGMYDVVIAPDVTRLKENLHKTLPEENGILVTSNHDHITLHRAAFGHAVRQHLRGRRSLPCLSAISAFFSEPHQVELEVVRFYIVVGR